MMGATCSPDIHPEASASAAFGIIAGQLLETFEGNLPGVRRKQGDEPLHDVRVSLRRLRAAIGHFRELFAATEYRRLATELRWLGRASGKARDADIALAALTRLLAQGQEPPEVAQSLLRAAAAQRSRSYQAFLRAIDCRRGQSLLAVWRQLAQAPPGTAPSPPCSVWAATALKKSLRRVRRRGRELGNPPTPAALHQLRIACKKLRYLLEFIQSLLPVEAAEKVLAELRRVQDALGAGQDSAVLLRWLDAQNSGVFIGPTGDVLERLRHCAEKSLEAAQRTALRAWRQLDARPHRRHLEQLRQGLKRSGSPPT